MPEPNTAAVLLIDDEEEVLLSCAQTLDLEGFQVRAEQRAARALQGLTADWPGTIVSDVRMPDMDGFALLAAVQQIDPEIPVVLITGHGDVAMAMRAVRNGAYDFIEKPAAPEQLVEIVRRAQEQRRLVLENRALRARLAGLDRLDGRIIGRSAAAARLRALITDLADTDVDVLIQGETGVGKEVAARSLHDFGRRRDKPFVAVNCGAIPEAMIETELFGHEAGAFTGAQGRRTGKLEYADGGTLFLDEIESMPMSVQVRLLRALQERAIERLGGNALISVNIRVVAATKVDLLELVADGSFREDLYYRLNVITLPVPPLRERAEDIPLLLVHFATLAAARMGRAEPELGPELLARLLAHHWPGNVRELRNVAERAVLGVQDPLGGLVTELPGGDTEPLAEVMDRVERAVLEAALSRHGGRIGRTAEALGILRKSLYLKMRKHGLDKGHYREE
ncbi:MAG TPA: sigma-54 dependent transcriptional regulator [Gammaproteobacteria bacterium]|nr:sigma-54 dependent transcriptional regulator [Gammaproteobacteria bacterium]